MLINMAAMALSNLVQTIVQHPVFRETINSILTATNQEQSCLLFRLKSRNARGASYHPAFMRNCLTISHLYQPYLTSRLVILVVDVNQENQEAGGVQDSLVQLQKLLLRPSWGYNKIGQGHIQNPVKHSAQHPRWSSSAEIANSLNTLTISGKKLCRRCLTGFQMRLRLEIL